MPPPIKVELMPYAECWPELALQEIGRISAALGGVVEIIHHIGSTSIPGISAKPIIDLMPVVTNLEALDCLQPTLEGIGYHWWGELGISGRRYCTRDDMTGRRLFQLHCFQSDSPHIRRHLAFRDYLCAHPDRAAAYEIEKLRCAALNPDDSHAYSDCKAGWIMELESEALDWTE